MRRRRTRYQWFPVLGSVNASGENTRTIAPFRIQAITTDSDTTNANVLFLPLTTDYTQEQDQSVSASLRDIVEGQSWLLKRLVGKIHLSVFPGIGDQGVNITVWNSVLVTVGFFVARADDTDQNFLDLEVEEGDPLATDNIMDPWIWRRSWRLWNPGTLADQPLLYGSGSNLPVSTAQYGSVIDGGHIDSKVARKIEREHRLWMAISTMGGDPARVAVGGNNGQQPVVEGWLDLRILGKLTKQRRTSSF